MALTAQALVDLVQALQQTPGEQAETALFPVERDELGAEIHHIIAQDTLDAVVEAVLQPHQRVALHTVVQLQRHIAGADKAAFVFHYELFDTRRTLLEYV